jgi:hypothetical protein
LNYTWIQSSCLPWYVTGGADGFTSLYEVASFPDFLTSAAFHTDFRELETALLFCLGTLAPNNLKMNKNGFLKEAVSRISWIAML